MTAKKGQGIQIRLATFADAEAIVSLLSKSFVEYQSRYTPEGYAATVPTLDEIEHRLNEGPVQVAVENGEMVGTVSAVLRREGLYIRGMAVHPSARGKRIGRHLLDCTQEFAIHKRCQRLFLSTTPFLSSAIKLYEHYGFHPKRRWARQFVWNTTFHYGQDSACVRAPQN